MSHHKLGGTGILVLFAIAVATVIVAGSLAVADGSFESAMLDRDDWWPHATGPHYGEVAQNLRNHPGVIQLEVGSFDTRGPGWTLPASLRFTEEESRKPDSLWLVQLQGPITDDKKEQLRSAGATIHSFHPVNTFLVRAGNPSRLAGIPGVLWAGPYHPAYRIEPTLGQAPTIDPVKARNETLSVRVRLFEAGDKPQAIGKLQALGAVIDQESTNDEHDLPNRVYFTATPETILAAARLQEVVWVEEISTEAFPLNSETTVVVQSGRIEGGTPYWDAGVDGSTQIVGVMDSGMDVDTFPLSNTVDAAGHFAPTHRKVQQYSAWGGGDFTTCGTSGYTHGTNTSQCAVGNQSDFGMPENRDGVARGARIVFQDLGGPGNCNLGVPNSMFGMYDEVRAHGGFLTNGSFVTCAYGSYGASAFDLDQYGWDHREFLAFFSGGNGGGGNACPGTNKNHISSGGHYQFPFENEFFGSYGPAPSGRVGPTILAPACDHFGGNPAPFNYRTSTSVQSNDNDILGIPSGDEELVQGVCGTSFSSPYLLGVAALIRDYFEKGVWPTGAIDPDDGFSPSGALIKAGLINAGDYVENCVGCVFPGLMGSMGMGRVNLSSSFALAGNPSTPTGTRIVDKGMDVGVGTSEVFEEWINVVDTTQPVKITLVWVDRPGSTLTNDLRLQVIGPDGTTDQRYIGNNFTNTGPYSVSIADGGTIPDAINVFEAVRINPDALVAGVWKVQIQGGNVPMGDPLFGDTQPFVLLASGGFDSLGIDEVSSIGSVPLRAVARTSTEVTWEWDAAPDPNIDYSFYRGTIASIITGSYDHAMIDAGQCGVAGDTTIVADADDGASSYYLVAGHKNGNDGPLGEDRPDAAPQCP